MSRPKLRDVLPGMDLDEDPREALRMLFDYFSAREISEITGAAIQGVYYWLRKWEILGETDQENMEIKAMALGFSSLKEYLEASKDSPYFEQASVLSTTEEKVRKAYREIVIEGGEDGE